MNVFYMQRQATASGGGSVITFHANRWLAAACILPASTAIVAGMAWIFSSISCTSRMSCKVIPAFLFGSSDKINKRDQ